METILFSLRSSLFLTLLWETGMPEKEKAGYHICKFTCARLFTFVYFVCPPFAVFCSHDPQNCFMLPCSLRYFCLCSPILKFKFTMFPCYPKILEDPHNWNKVLSHEILPTMLIKKLYSHN